MTEQKNKLLPEDSLYPRGVYFRSKDKFHLAWLQRERRKKTVRIDYANVDPRAKAIIDALRNDSIHGTASAILNRIVLEWARQNYISDK